MWRLPAAVNSARSPEPVKLPQHHSRSVFTICFGALPGVATASEAPLSASVASDGGCLSGIGMLTTSMDRTTLVWRYNSVMADDKAWQVGSDERHVELHHAWIRGPTVSG